jgi:hypothetical protein
MEKVIIISNRKESQNDLSFWKSKSVQERFDAIEILRLQYLQLNKNVQQGLQRVCTVTQRKSS